MRQVDAAAHDGRACWRRREGRVLHDGAPVRGVNHALGFVFQQDAVFPWLTVEGNIEYGPKSRGVPKAEREKLVAQWCEAVGLTAFRKAYPKQLSGGMRKRVDLARAYANSPDVLLMDEPFAALDVQTKGEMQEAVLELWQSTRQDGGIRHARPRRGGVPGRRRRRAGEPSGPRARDRGESAARARVTRRRASAMNSPRPSARCGSRCRTRARKRSATTGDRSRATMILGTTHQAAIRETHGRSIRRLPAPRGAVAVRWRWRVRWTTRARAGAPARLTIGVLRAPASASIDLAEQARMVQGGRRRAQDTSCSPRPRARRSCRRSAAARST